MPITEVVSNARDLTLTVIGDYPVPVERLWDAHVDPRQLERFWGPEQWPATFTRHDVAVGGQSQYYMTGPDGTTAHGWFRFTAVEPRKRIELIDGFGEASDTPTPGMPTMRMVFTFQSTPTGSRVKNVTTFPSVEAMEQLVNMGMVDGIKSAMGQADAVLADLKSFATGRVTEAQMLSDTQVRVSRVIRGSAAQVWKAHQDPLLLPKWLTGPDGWTMPVCRIANTVGDRYRYEWEKADGSERFGFEGVLLELAEPYRAVTTEELIGSGGPSTRNELTLTPVEGGTLLSIVITYPSRELRDMILGTGMTSGMETSYVRLEQALQAA